jgi:hypothetical protein
MPSAVLKTPEMARSLAKIVLEESRGSKGLSQFSSLNVDDLKDMWVIWAKTQFIEDPYLENESFYLRVFKQTAEILNVGVVANFKFSPEMKEMIGEERKADAHPAAVTLYEDARSDLQMEIFLNGGVIRSKEAACRFGELALAAELPDTYRQSDPLYAEEIDGLWHVSGRRVGSAHAQSGRFEMIFRRTNAQVVSINFPSK